MARLKRSGAPRWWPIERKTKKYTVSPRGPHPKEMSLPLSILIRDIFKLTETGKEAKRIIKKGDVFLDGKKRKDPNFGVGLLDVVEIPTLEKFWRAVPKNGLSLIEIPKEESKVKICKILNKKTLKGNKTQLNLHDGRNIITNENYSTNDSLLIELPEQKVIDHIKFEQGSTVLVIGGGNAGKIARIKTIEKGKTWLDNEKFFEVPNRLIIAVGKDKPLIKLE